MNRSESGNLDLLAASYLKEIAARSDLENPKGPSPWLTFGVATALTLVWIYLNIRHWKEPNADYMAIAASIIVTALLWTWLVAAALWNIRNGREARRIIIEAQTQQIRLDPAAANKPQELHVIRFDYLPDSPIIV